MTYIFNIIFCVSIMRVFLHVFRYQFSWNLLNNVTLIVKCERLFGNIMKNRTSDFDKQSGDAFCWKSTSIPEKEDRWTKRGIYQWGTFWRAYHWYLKEDHITEDNKEYPNTEKSKTHPITEKRKQNTITEDLQVF